MSIALADGRLQTFVFAAGLLQTGLALDLGATTNACMAVTMLSIESPVLSVGAVVVAFAAVESVIGGSTPATSATGESLD